MQIGDFATLVGLSIPQLRRYDRMQLLEPDGRSEAGYRRYSTGQTGAGRVISLLRSIDVPIADIRRVLAGIADDERRQLFADHRSRLEARLDEVRRLLDAVDSLTKEEPMTVNAPTELSSWLHVMPRIPVSNVQRSIDYYQEALGLRLAWQTGDGSLSAIASGAIEVLLLVPWQGEGAPPSQSAYVYVEDPDGLCAEYQAAGGAVVEPVATRPYGMRDFVAADPDGHRFTLGCGTEALRDVADHYGLDPEEIGVDPDWLRNRH
jgi:DNA-binding transcriptional MerR regulator